MAAQGSANTLIFPLAFPFWFVKLILNSDIIFWVVAQLGSFCTWAIFCFDDLLLDAAYQGLKIKHCLRTVRKEFSEEPPPPPPKKGTNKKQDFIIKVVAQGRWSLTMWLLRDNCIYKRTRLVTVNLYINLFLC